MRTPICFAIVLGLAMASWAQTPLHLPPPDREIQLYAGAAPGSEKWNWVESTFTTRRGKELINEAQKAQFQHTGGTIAVDLQKVLATVGTVTAYGANLSTDPKMVDGALVAQGTPDLRKIAESQLLQATISSPERVTELTDFEDFSVKLRTPMHLAGIAKVTDAGLEARFQTFDPALAPQPVWLRMGSGVRVLFVKV